MRVPDELCSLANRVLLSVFMSLSSYYNLSSVTIFVCAPSPRPFIDLWAPNLAGRSGRGTKNTSRKRNF